MEQHFGDIVRLEVWTNAQSYRRARVTAVVMSASAQISDLE